MQHIVDNWAQNNTQNVYNKKQRSHHVTAHIHCTGIATAKQRLRKNNTTFVTITCFGHTFTDKYRLSMLTVSGRGGPAVASAVRAVTQAVGARSIQPTPAGSQLLSHWEEREEITPPIIPYEYQWLATHVDAPSRPRPQTSYAIGKSLFTRQLTAGSGVGVGTHVRYYHNDIKVPNFENYRHPKTKDPNRAAKESRDERRLTLDAVKIGVGVTGAIVAKRIGQTLVANLSPAQSTLAMGVIDIDLSAVPEGKSILVKWNGMCSLSLSLSLS
ncbi:unnamed protein product, partial [Medioppia subpectinata]